MSKPINSSAQHSSVIGLQYGDEGKGQLVDYLCAKHQVIARYNGGANAGHSVAIGNQKFVLHQIPIGCLTPGKTNIMGNGMVLSIDGFLDELNQLKQVGVNVTQLHVSENIHLVMPWHYIEEKLRHRLTVDTMSEDDVLGTTFRGMGPCYADKAARDTAIRACDLYQVDSLQKRLKLIIALKNAQHQALAELIGESFTPYQLDEITAQCASWATQIKQYLGNTSKRLVDLENENQAVLFEGANAAMLDLDFGTYPFVTSSNGSNLGIATGTGVLPTRLEHRYGVAKCYMSRVGSGPFVTEVFSETADQIREVGAEYGSTTERPRRIGWLDLPALNQCLAGNKINHLVLTGLSILAQLPEFKVCTAYTLDGETIDELPNHVETLAKLVPVYSTITVDGPITDPATSALNPWVESLLSKIRATISSSHGETKISAICTGKRRDQILWLDR